MSGGYRAAPEILQRRETIMWKIEVFVSLGMRKEDAIGRALMEADQAAIEEHKQRALDDKNGT